MADSARARGLKVSLLHHPVYPLSYSLEVFRTAEELGFYACYCADAYRFKDPWTLLAAAAGATRRIRLGVNATHVFLRDPTLVAQSLATLARPCRTPAPARRPPASLTAESFIGRLPPAYTT